MWHPHRFLVAPQPENWLQSYDALIGVVLGFALSLIPWWFDRRSKAKAIRSELENNLGLLPQKIDHLRKMAEALERQELLSGMSVPLMSTEYRGHIAHVGRAYFGKNMPNLHIIYGIMEKVDDFMNSFEERYFNRKQTLTHINWDEVYASRCREMIDQCELASTLTKELLNNVPRRVLWS